MPDLDCLEVRPSRLDWTSESAEALSLPIVLLVFVQVVAEVLVVVVVLVMPRLEQKREVLKSKLLKLGLRRVQAVFRVVGLVVLVTTTRL